jgi:hypothetical protein
MQKGGQKKDSEIGGISFAMRSSPFCVLAPRVHIAATLEIDK